MQAGIVAACVAPHGLQAHPAHHIGDGQQALEIPHGQAAQRGYLISAADQRMTLSGTGNIGRDTRPCRRLLRREPFSLIPAFAFAEDHKADMGGGNQVTDGAAGG